MNARGLHINLAPGKTEAIISTHGEGSLKFKQALAFDHHFELLLANGDRLRVVSKYKHLGGYATADGSAGPELAY
eukprot:3823212-Karenia_brevis.AAC.1